MLSTIGINANKTNCIRRNNDHFIYNIMKWRIFNDNY